MKLLLTNKRNFLALWIVERLSKPMKENIVNRRIIPHASLLAIEIWCSFGAVKFSLPHGRIGIQIKKI